MSDFKMAANVRTYAAPVFGERARTRVFEKKRFKVFPMHPTSIHRELNKGNKVPLFKPQ